jgi:hypothetical protein
MLAVLASATCAYAQAPLGFERVVQAPPEAAIEFVHIEREQGGLRLGVFTHRRQLVSWDPVQGSTGDALLQLGSREWFFRSADARRLGIRAFQSRTPQPGDPPGTTLETSLVLPKGPAQVSASILLGPQTVRVSDDATTLLIAPVRGDGPVPVRVAILRLDNASPRAYASVGGYDVRRPGRVQMSRSGEVIAQQDGAQVRLLDGLGQELASMSAGIGFHLAPRGNVLAVRHPDRVEIRRLRGGVPDPASLPASVSVSSPPLGVAFAGGHALVRSRDELVLLEWSSGTEVWRRTSPGGTYVSADLRPIDGARPWAAAGRLRVGSPPHRSGGAFVPGRARAFVEVLDESGQLAFRVHEFPVRRWTHEEPRVRLVDDARRVLVRTGDVVLLSEVMP